MYYTDYKNNCKVNLLKNYYLLNFLKYILILLVTNYFDNKNLI